MREGPGFSMEWQPQRLFLFIGITRLLGQVPREGESGKKPEGDWPGPQARRTRFKGGADGRLHLELWQDARLSSEKRASPDFTAGAAPSKAAILS